MDRLQSLRVFVKVVEAGSFVGAGTALDMSNSVVTRHVADLEKSLGTRLINRSTRHLSLTETGQEYLVRVRQILQDMDDADTIASANAQEPSGTLRIFSNTGFGQVQLAHLLPKFSETKPNVEVDVTLSERSDDLVKNGYDVGIFNDFQKIDPSMIVRQLATTEILVCASPDYIEKYGAPETPEDISQHFCLNFSYEQLRHFWPFPSPDGEGYFKVPIKGKVTSNNGELLRRCALAGMGLLLRTSFVLGDDVASGKLVRLLPNHHLGKLVVSMVYPSRRQMSAKVRSFVDFMIAQFPEPEVDPWIAEIGISTERARVHSTTGNEPSQFQSGRSGRKSPTRKQA
jgi:DNA-binding transcriptional LysR family regulator